MTPYNRARLQLRANFFDEKSVNKAKTLTWLINNVEEQVVE